MPNIIIFPIKLRFNVANSCRKHGRICICSNDRPKKEFKVMTKLCNTRCDGDQSAYCGSQGTISVYSSIIIHDLRKSWSENIVYLHSAAIVVVIAFNEVVMLLWLIKVHFTAKMIWEVLPQRGSSQHQERLKHLYSAASHCTLRRCEFAGIHWANLHIT